MNILFVPHYPLGTIRTRGEELAAALAASHNVYYLTWNITLSNSRVKKGVSVLKRLIAPSRTSRSEDFSAVQKPIFAAHSLPRLTISLNRVNIKSLFLRRLIEEHEIDVIINESIFFFDFSVQDRPFIYDLVDYHPGMEANCDPLKRDFLLRQIRNASKVFVCSHYLKGLVQEKYDVDALVVPNGVWVSRFRESPSIDIRAKYNLQGKFVIGFIGNHYEWSGLDFLIEVFRQAKRSDDSASLLVVGPGTDLQRMIRKVNDEKIKDVIFTGPVLPKDIHAYFKSIDLGVLPFSKIPLTDNALPLKILEYTASQKMIIATPLEELIRMKLSNLRLVERDVEKWRDAVLESRSSCWDSKWNSEIEEFDWRIAAQKVEKALRRCVVC